MTEKKLFIILYGLFLEIDVKEISFALIKKKYLTIVRA